MKAKKSQYRSQNRTGHTINRAKIRQKESAQRRLRGLPLDTPGAPPGTSDLHMDLPLQKEEEEEEEEEKLQHLLCKVETELKEHEEVAKAYLKAMLELSWTEIANFQEAELNVIDIPVLHMQYLHHNASAYDDSTFRCYRLCASSNDPDALQGHGHVYREHLIYCIITVPQD
ncbi:hypothetical protein ARMGADRAFT_1090620 [Armillaria gallica]|uniref:Uncharacterized protein n=1 Tax=Armillaria gallica TaxID=47427 RepID=A0A2H3D3H3_ARMGA|nr:hypothetical protein ARMGADRAFT_1090620 [Armillaria gallica]